MARFHVNKDTGNPGECTASVKPCPHGGLEDHFDTKWEAMKHYEEAQGSQSAPALSKKSPSQPPKVKNAPAPKKVTAQEVTTPKTVVTGTENTQVISKEPYGSAPKDEPNPTLYHNSRLRVEEAANGPASKNSTKKYYTLNSGTLNPVTKEGTGSDYAKDNGGMLILGTADGKRLRVVQGSGDNNPDDVMGQKVIQVKQSGHGDAHTDGLVVLGVKNSDGKSYGYIPDRKVSYFVFK